MLHHLDLETNDNIDDQKKRWTESDEFSRRKVVKKVLTHHHPIDKKSVAKRRFKEKPSRTSFPDEFYFDEASSALNRTDTDSRCKNLSFLMILMKNEQMLKLKMERKT